MLVLSREVDQVIRIGTEVEVQIVQIKGGRVQVGITAPREVRVVRGELTTYKEGKTRAS